MLGSGGSAARFAMWTAIRLCASVDDLEKYADELGESDMAFALDHPKISEAFKARRAVLAENAGQPIYYGDRIVG